MLQILLQRAKKCAQLRGAKAKGNSGEEEGSRGAMGAGGGDGAVAEEAEGAATLMGTLPVIAAEAFATLCSAFKRSVAAVAGGGIPGTVNALSDDGEGEEAEEEVDAVTALVLLIPIAPPLGVMPSAPVHLPLILSKRSSRMGGTSADAAAIAFAR